MDKLNNKFDVLTVTLDDGRRITWKDYTSYEVRSGLFIIKCELQWIGIYNLSHVVSVEVDTCEVEE